MGGNESISCGLGFAFPKVGDSQRKGAVPESSNLSSRRQVHEQDILENVLTQEYPT